MNIYVRTSTHVYVRMYVYTCIYEYICTHKYACVCTYVCMNEVRPHIKLLSHNLLSLEI